MQDWTPIRKVAAGFIAAGIAYVAVQLGVDLGDEDVKEAALAIAGVLTAYLVKS
jgi:hypothetical protein